MGGISDEVEEVQSVPNGITEDIFRQQKTSKPCSKNPVWWVMGVATLLAGGLFVMVVVLITRTGLDNTFDLIVMAKPYTETKYIIELDNTDSELHRVLEEYQKASNGNFMFSTTDNKDSGKIIDSVNGLQQNEATTGHWVLGKRTSKTCVKPADLLSYIPVRGDNIILAYITQKEAGDYFACSDEDQPKLQISVWSLLQDIQFTNTSYFASYDSKLTLIDILEGLQNENLKFRFTTVEYAGLGKMLTSVNGLKQNSTLKTYWALGKVTEGKLCLLSVGASSYQPLADEQIVLTYITYDMFSAFSPCNNQTAHDSRATIQISVQNLVGDIAFVNSSYTVKMEINTTLFEVMEDLQDTDSDFRFTTNEHAKIGKSITSINGLSRNATLKNYWSIAKVVDGKRCLLPVGVSKYQPNPDEHIIFAYIPLDMFGKIPSCDGKCWYNCMSIEISVYNFIDNIAFVNSSYAAEGVTNTTLIDIMKQLNESESNFRFTTVGYSGLGEMITSVNGLEQNTTMKMHWALGKMNEGTMCLLSVGASSYRPITEDQIVLAYITYDMFNDFPSCDNQITHDIQATIQISVQNLVEDIAFVNSSYMAGMEMNTTLIDVMEDLRDTDPNFRFTTTEYAGLGKSITSINGLSRNATLKNYWSIAKVVDGKRCLLPVGASTYRPNPDEHIIFAYIPLDMFSKIPSCDGGCGHDCISIEISVYNFIENIAFVNSSYAAEGATNTTLIDIMKQLNESESSFRFTTVEYSGLGEMITSVNGLEQNTTMKTYWALGKMDEGTMCLLSVGASSYHPDAEEKIVLAYISYDMFNDFPSCDNQITHDSRATIQISVQSLIPNVSFVNSSYIARMETNATLLDVMNDLRDADSDFRFIVIDDSAHGKFITSINGLEQNKTLQHYWSLSRAVEGWQCLLPVGAGKYQPYPDEHIILAYIPIAMFRTIPWCEAGDGHDSISIEISVHNLVDNIEFVNSSYTAEGKMNATLIEFMNKLRDSDSDFRFTTIEYVGLGEMITSINGLEQNATLKNYWSISKVVEGGRCSLPVGASTYRPNPDEHIIFAYIPLDMFGTLPSCDGGCGHDCISIEINVYNFIGNIAFVNSSYMTEDKINTTLIDLMNTLQDTDSNFRFTTVEYSGLGKMITSVNGLEQNSTLNSYWALGKAENGTMCLLSVGASSYRVMEEEHLILAYITYDMFNSFASCDNDNAHDSFDLEIIVSVQNDYENLGFYSVKGDMDSTLLDVMRKLNDTNNYFSFTTESLEQGLSTVITSVNGRYQTSDFFWAVGKMGDVDMCLISTGIDVYKPIPGDQIFLMYYDTDTFATFSYCQVPPQMILP